MLIDPRDRRNGKSIPAGGGYVDQPYIVQTHDGAWLCVMTTGPGSEGDRGQHVVATRSLDRGATWERAVPIEPLGPPEASWVTPLIVPSGRIYVFYVYNGDAVASVPGGDGTEITRVDSLGHYVFRYSDDGGRSWSDRRYRVPLEPTAMDRANTTHGETIFFWGVGKPVLHERTAYLSLSRVGNFVRDGFFERTEGIVLRSDTIVDADDPGSVRWVQLPASDGALHSPDGPVAEEHNISVMSGGTLYCAYRSIDGHLVEAYSGDRGDTWTRPEHIRFASGRKIKHPRAAGFVRRFTNGKYVLWFHNHSRPYYTGRNPVWVAGGVERDGRIEWSEPEILLYDEDPSVRMSYPDFIEDDGRYYVTETQKTRASVHEIDPALLEAMWDMASTGFLLRGGPILDLDAATCSADTVVAVPQLEPITPAGGLTLEVWARRLDGDAAAALVTSRDRFGIGFELRVRPDGVLDFAVGDRRGEAAASTTVPVVDDTWRHIVVIVDGGPRIISFVVDGVLHDGGDHVPAGWTRFAHDVGSPTGFRGLTIGSDAIQVRSLALYGHALRTAEAVARFRSGSR